MSMSIARSAALAGVIAGGVLCQTLISQPAHADYYAFGSTQHPVCGAAQTAGCAELSLSEGSAQINLFTDGDQGWISTNTLNIGGPGSINTSYLVGYTHNSSFNDYFAFNLKAVSSNVTITSAKLTVFSGKITNNLQYSLFGATEWLSEIAMGSPNATLYNNMACLNGSTQCGASYGSFLIHDNNSSPMSNLVFTLNSLAVKDINTAIKERAEFGIAGHVAAPAPEPSTWLMMLAGFAGLGVLGARRQATRRRAAALAG
jgi:hypothetical protein